MAKLLTATAHCVRAHIAHALLHDADAPTRIGDVSLRPHQRSAVQRLRHLLRHHGGALLADDVGLGKTFVAIALIRETKRAAVVTPAALRDMWRHALARAGANAEITSYDALSRGRSPTGPFDLVVLDEAHHARNHSTRRYTSLAMLTANTPTLLLSATPIHNHENDLAALLALFLGAQAWQLDHNQRAAFIVRREHDDVPDSSLPQLLPPTWLAVGDDAPLLAQITALPPPLPPRDGYDGGALVIWGLARLWASSHGALIHALDRRLAQSTALQSSLAVGRYPSRATLGAWTCGDDAIQLSFPEVFHDPSPDTGPLLEAVATHSAAIQALRTRARESAWTDLERVRHIRQVRAAHPGEKIIAFSQFTHTVRTLFTLMRHDPGIALLTARGGCIAGGRLPRQDTLARFAPRALGAPHPPAAERIDLLLTTDLLSEGTNLHDASVVIHLDLPWTPARLEQRVGRARRLGSAHQRVAVYAITPPAAAEDLLHVEQRLRTKLRAAGRAIGATGSILPNPSLAPSDLAPAGAQHHEALLRILARWLHDTPDPADPADPAAAPTAHVTTTRPCIAALLLQSGTHHLAASVDNRPLDDSTTGLVEAATLLTDAPETDPRTPTYCLTRDALRLVDQWIARRAATAAGGGTLPLHAPGRRHAMRRIATITAHTPHHRRSTIAPLAERARRAITLPFGIGAERVLHDLAAAPLPDEAWLRALGTFADTQSRSRSAPPQPAAQVARPTLAALLIGTPPPP